MPRLAPPPDGKPVLLSGGNPQIAKGYGEAWKIACILTRSLRDSSIAKCLCIAECVSSALPSG